MAASAVARATPGEDGQEMDPTRSEIGDLGLGIFDWGLADAVHHQCWLWAMTCSCTRLRMKVLVLRRAAH
jgi:hypothetical protein